jgi:DNA-binding HxlR family transcriptional regulator
LLCAMKVTGMQNKSDVVCFCPLEGIIDVISKKWALLIIKEIWTLSKKGV